MDTRFWGPSAWQLFHLVSMGPHPEKVLHLMKDILPCKFCRASTSEFVGKHPYDPKDPAKWLYEIHTMVNHKLKTQCATDPAVPDPGPDPSFEDVKHKYEAMKPTAVPGRDFLFAIARNYEGRDPETQIRFLDSLSLVFPFHADTFQAYLKKHPVDLDHYLKWMYGLLAALSKKFRVSIPTFRGYAHHVAYYKSGCSKKTYHGKTCRNGTKTRDHRKTQRLVHKRLL